MLNKRVSTFLAPSEKMNFENQRGAQITFPGLPVEHSTESTIRRQVISHPDFETYHAIGRIQSLNFGTNKAIVIFTSRLVISCNFGSLQI
jgi:hypothetical protein